MIPSVDGSEVTIPISIGEWLLSFWKFHMKERHNPDIRKRPIEGIVYPGDVIFVPHNYWHCVINLDESIAITHNYVSKSNLADCLRFLRDKEDQISGIRDRSGTIRPEEMYSKFIEKLPTVLSDSEIQEAIALSYQNRNQRSDTNTFNIRRLNENSKGKSSSIFSKPVNDDHDEFRGFQFNF